MPAWCRRYNIDADQWILPDGLAVYDGYVYVYSTSATDDRVLRFPPAAS